MSARRIRISPATRALCVQSVVSAPDGWFFAPPVEPTRSLDANAKLHAMCADVARQKTWAGRQLGTEDWKRLFVDFWLRQDGGRGVQIVPSLDGAGVVSLGVQTRSLGVRAMSELIETIYAWGSENGVRFTDAKAEVPGWAA